MDAYIAPALLAYFLTGFLAVEADRRLNPEDAPGYVERRGMRMLVRLAWPLLKPKWLLGFMVVFCVDYLIYWMVSDYIDTVLWRAVLTGAISLPLLAILSPFISIITIPLAIAISPFIRKK
jgi:hypothetical protein